MSPTFKTSFAGFGVLTQLLLASLIAAHVPSRTALRAAETAAVAQPQPSAPAAAKLERVIITFKTHFDIGYTDLAANVVQRYRTEMIDQALEVVRPNGRPAARPAVRLDDRRAGRWPRSWRTGTGQTAERKAAGLAAFRDGRFVMHALPFTTHTELLELEDLVRGLGFSSRLSRAGGLPLPRDAKMTDVPCHTWIMPTLLRHAGVDFLHLGCNAGSSSPEVPLLFWWEGPDGSRLLTMYIAEGYGTGLMPPDDWPYKTWLALIHTGDNARAAEAGGSRAVAAGGREASCPASRSASAGCPILPTRSWPRSRAAGRPRRHARHVDSRPDVRSGRRADRAEHPPGHRGVRVAATRTCAAWGVDAAGRRARRSPRPTKTACCTANTRGAARCTGSRRTPSSGTTPTATIGRRNAPTGEFARLEASWDEHTAYIETAHEPDRAAAAKPAAGARARRSRSTGPRIVVYNPLPWKRDGVVRVAVGERGRSRRSSRRRAARRSRSRRTAPTVRFVARDVPAVGYRTYVPADE